MIIFTLIFYIIIIGLIIFAGLVVAGVISFIYDLAIGDRKERKKREIKEKKRIEIKEKQISNYNDSLHQLEEQLGVCSLDINLGNYYIDSHVLFFEEAQTIVIQSKEYKFYDILGCSLVDDITNNTLTTSEGTSKTSTGSMIGRAVVGGALTGGLGALAGAATAKKKTKDYASSITVTNHNYTLYINVNSLETPVITLHLGDKVALAQKLAAAINVIIERNKS